MSSAYSRLVTGVKQNLRAAWSATKRQGEAAKRPRKEKKKKKRKENQEVNTEDDQSVRIRKDIVNPSTLCVATSSPH
jgi:hypothetical protein